MVAKVTDEASALFEAFLFASSIRESLKFGMAESRDNSSKFELTQKLRRHGSTNMLKARARNVTFEFSPAEPDDTPAYFSADQCVSSYVY